MRARLRWFAIVLSVWTVVHTVGALAVVVRSLSGEVALGRFWYLPSLISIPVWALVTPPIFALSRRAVFDRRHWPRAVALHLVGLAAVMAFDAFAMWLDYAVIEGGALTYGQAIWKWSFIDAFFYASIVAVEHAIRYYRLYVERRMLASELETRLARAQLQALQMQIRPHFLFNALNTIAGLVRVDDKATAIEMLAGLGELLRILLRSDGAQLVPLARELELVQHYLRIEKIRFGDQLDVEVTVQPGLETAMIPNLILQPLVENAIRHGIAAAGRVEIRVERDGATLRMSVLDSGTAEPVENTSGIGISNTRARLESLYGTAHRFELSHHTTGTSATIEIPLRL